MRVRETPPSEPERCPYCRDGVEGNARTCSGCGTRVHSECWSEHGGCSLLGCEYGAPSRPGEEEILPFSGAERLRLVGPEALLGGGLSLILVLGALGALVGGVVFLQDALSGGGGSWVSSVSDLVMAALTGLVGVPLCFGGAWLCASIIRGRWRAVWGLPREVACRRGSLTVTPLESKGDVSNHQIELCSPGSGASRSFVNLGGLPRWLRGRLPLEKHPVGFLTCREQFAGLEMDLLLVRLEERWLILSTNADEEAK